MKVFGFTLILLTIFGLTSATTIKVTGHIFCCYGGAFNVSVTTTTPSPHATQAIAAPLSPGFCLPIEGALIELWEEDRPTNELNHNDFLSSVLTDSKGTFSVSGSNSEIGEEQFYVMAKTQCGQQRIGWDKQFCKRISTVYINTKFNDGTYAFWDHPPFHAWVIDARETGGNDKIECE